MFLLKQMAHAHSRPAEMLDGIAAVTGLLNNVHLIRGTISSPSLSGVPILECERRPWCHDSDVRFSTAYRKWVRGGGLVGVG